MAPSIQWTELERTLPNNPRIAIIDSDAQFLNETTALFSECGYMALGYPNGSQFLQSHSGRPGAEMLDGVIVCRKLPDMDGLQILQSLQNGTDPAPAIILICPEQSCEVVECLQAGAADAIVKSTHFTELKIRLQKAMLQQKLLNTPKPAVSGVFDSPALLNEIQNSSDLSRAEMDILRALYNAQGRVVLRKSLAESFQSTSRTGRALDVHISSLRKKLKSFPVEIMSVRNQGYQLILQVWQDEMIGKKVS